MKRPLLILLLLGVMAFSLAAWVQPRMDRVAAGRKSENVIKLLFGEGRRMFANHFVVKADVYLHSGYYPSIFDQAAAAEKTGGREGQGAAEPHVHTPDCDHSEDADHAGEAETMPGGHKCDTSFMGPPRDWIEKMGRHFVVTEHAHLEGGKEREILPWLKLSAELDPHRIETYTVAAYWLSERLGKPDKAEAFLRQGLRANPQSYEILYELGKIYDLHLKQPDRARSVWLLGLRRWDEVEAGRETPDKFGRERILVYLARLERTQGNNVLAASYLEEAKKYSHDPAALDDQIRQLWLKLPDPRQNPQ